MEVELTVRELAIFKNLSSNIPKKRKKALTDLENYIIKTIKSRGFTPRDMDRLATGLRYTMWMQDKPLDQEQLADNVGKLMTNFPNDEDVIEFMRSMLRVLSKNWHEIDHWRVDKFLLLIRRLFRAFFIHVSRQKWNRDLVDKVIIFLQQTVVTPEDGGICETIKLHVANVYLEELEHAGGLPADQVIDFLDPYAKLMQKPNTSDYLFGAVCTEIFGGILEVFAMELEKAQADVTDKHTDTEQDKTDQCLQFDYKEIALFLRTTAKHEMVTSKRRKRILELAKKFDKVASGRNPFNEIIAPSKKDPIGPKVISKAVQKLVSAEKKRRLRQAKFKKEYKKIRKIKPLMAF